ncbi:MAG: flagellar biosynthetic protein FliO [Treponema sp.]|nr:flagellar biosynthetic protein FliO [Treponema sp.]
MENLKENLKRSEVLEGNIQIISSFFTFRGLLILFVLLVAQSAFPQIPDQSQIIGEETLVLTDESLSQEAVPSSVSTFLVILRLVLVLVLASVAIYGLVFFLKKFFHVQEQKDPFLKILAGLSLGANRFIHIVSVGEKAWLVGSADGGVALLAEINDKETVDAMLVEESRRSAEKAKASGFATLMRRASKTTPYVGEPPKAENVRKSRERLKGL